MYVVVGSLCGVFGDTMRFKALKLTKATTLQVFDPSCILFQFIFDVTVFKVSYTNGQYGSLGYLALLYILKVIKSVCYDKKRRERKREVMKMSHSME